MWVRLSGLRRRWRMESDREREELRRNDALRFADCWAKAETKLNDMEIQKDAVILALEARLAAAEEESHRGTQRRAELYAENANLKQRLAAAEAESDSKWSNAAYDAILSQMHEMAADTARLDYILMDKNVEVIIWNTIPRKPVPHRVKDRDAIDAARKEGKP